MQPPFKPETRVKLPKEFKNPSPASNLIPITLLGLGLIGIIGLTVSLTPKLTSLATKRTNPTTTQIATTVTIENNQEDNSLRVFWQAPVSEPEFWFNSRLVKATCEGQTCTLPKPSSSNQVYFRWLNNSDRQWYYFSCNGNYRGEFQGIPYSQ